MAAPTSTSYMRQIRGTAKLESYPVISGVQVNVGDLVYISGTGPVAPVSNYVLTSGTEIQSWSGARSQFLGVSMGQHNSYSTVSGTIPVALEGIFAFPIPVTGSGTTLAPGTFVSFTQTGPTSTSSGYFQPQALMQCSGQSTAIGKIADFSAVQSSGQGQVNVYLQSTLVEGTIGN
jgi:hypothetical protein